MFERAVLILKILCLLILAGLVLTTLTGCDSTNPLDPRNPVTLALWHPYGQQMGTAIEELIEEFNHTVGAEQGIIVQTTYIADASELNDRLLAAVNDDPGAPDFPDIAIIYPRVGIILAENDLLLDLSTQFSEEEISRYVPSFIEEGRFSDDDTLYILPIAKSTEVLYVNTTIFDRFAADTGVTLSRLATFEGLIDVAEKYYVWSGGKDFIHMREMFNLAMTGFHQLGEDFLANEEPNFSSHVYERIWSVYYPRAVQGGVAIFEGYGNYLIATGEAVCDYGTSASIIFYPDTVTYSDNTKEDLVLAILPQPVFEGGEKVALQRGGGLCIFKSNTGKEYAAGVFLKWLTDPEQNLRFIAQNGYLPVMEAAFNEFLQKGLDIVEDPNVMNVHETLIQMKREYSFYFPPTFDGYDEIRRNYNRTMMKEAENSRQEFLSLLDEHDPETAFKIASEYALEQFKSAMR